MTSLQKFALMKTSFVFVLTKRLEDVLKTSWSRTIYSSWPYVCRGRLQDDFKTSWSRRIYSSQSYVFQASSRRFQVDFKTSWRRLQDIFMNSWDVLKASLRHVFKTSSGLVFKSCLEVVLMSSSMHILKTSLRLTNVCWDW